MVNPSRSTRGKKSSAASRGKQAPRKTKKANQLIQPISVDFFGVVPKDWKPVDPSTTAFVQRVLERSASKVLQSKFSSKAKKTEVTKVFRGLISDIMKNTKLMRAPPPKENYMDLEDKNDEDDL